MYIKYIHKTKKKKKPRKIYDSIESSLLTLAINAYKIFLTNANKQNTYLHTENLVLNY